MLSNDSILSYENLCELKKQLFLCKNIEGVSAEIGVYKGNTSKIIKHTLVDKTHYCYDTFEGICNSSDSMGDRHKDGEFYCTLDYVKENINMDGVIYKKGFFPNTFDEYLEKFCFVYSDTGTYFGAKNTYLKFKNNIVSNGKLIFYIDDNNIGVKNAINEFINDINYNILYKLNFVIFTKI